MSLLKTVSALINSLVTYTLTHVLQYESERLKYARDLIEFDRKWSKLFRDKPQSEENEDGVSQTEILRYALLACSSQCHRTWDHG